MIEWTSSALFGILLCIFTYEIGLWINKKAKTPLANPLIISVILGSVLSLFPYIIGMTKKSVSIPIIIGSLVAFMQTPIMGRNPALTDAFLKIAILLIIALLGVKLTLINKINELDCSVN